MVKDCVWVSMESSMRCLKTCNLTRTRYEIHENHGVVVSTQNSIGKKHVWGVEKTTAKSLKIMYPDKKAV